MGDRARNVPTRELPNWLVRLAALRNPAMKMVVPSLGMVMDASSEKAARLLGWRSRAVEESLLATAESLVRFGLV